MPSHRTGQMRTTAGRAVLAVLLTAVVLAGGVADAGAAVRSGVGFDPDDGLGPRDVATVLAGYDSEAGSLDVQVFLAAAPTADPPALLVVTLLAGGAGGSCSSQPVATIETATVAGDRPILALAGAAGQRLALSKGVAAEAISLSARDPSLANLAIACVQVEIRSRTGSPAVIDALSQPVVLAETSSAGDDTPFDFGASLDQSSGAGAVFARFRVVRVSFRHLAARRMAIRVRLSGPGAVTASLRLGRRTARRLRTARIVARGSARTARRGRVVVVLRPRRSALARLRRRERVRAALLIGVGSPGTAPRLVRRTVTLS